MKNNKKTKVEDFNTVNFFRAVKEKISFETKGMSFTEFKEYISKRKLKTVR